MSPEQVRGQAVDQRADIFAIGAILYEMFTGRRAFSGNSPADLISAILHSEPSSIVSPPSVRPSALDRLIKKCLAKDPNERWQSCADLQNELTWIAEDLQVGLPAPAVKKLNSRQRFVWRVAGMVAVALVMVVAIMLTRSRKEGEPPPAGHFTVMLPAGIALAGYPVVSPDGQRVAFTAIERDGRRQLWVRPLNSESAQALPGTDEASSPFWSPDGNSLAFYVQDKLKRFTLPGGPAQVICEGLFPPGGTWSRQGVIVTSGADGRLYRVAATGGEPKPVTELDTVRKEEWHRWPAFLPDGRHFLYFVQNAEHENSGIYLESLDVKEKRLLVRAYGIGLYSPPGYVLFAQGSTLMAQPFDSSRLELSRGATPMAEAVWTTAPLGVGVFSVSENGVLVYRVGSSGATTELVWYDREGNTLGTIGDRDYYSNPSLSPDGKKLAVGVGKTSLKTRDIWIFDLEHGNRKSRLTFDPADDLNPAWSPDSRQIFFTSDRKGHRDIYRQSANNTGSVELVYASSEAKSVDQVSPDGRYIIYDTQFGTARRATSGGIWMLPLVGDASRPIPLVQGGDHYAKQPRLSPDGNYLAYVSDESGQNEIYVRTFPQATGKWQISNAGGEEPMWRGDGKELFYFGGERVMVAAVSATPSGFEAGTPKALFACPQPCQSVGRNRYIVTPDGKRFLFNAYPDQQTGVFHVLTNWMAGVNK
jgi:Tol biopolymer transport system component